MSKTKLYFKRKLGEEIKDVATRRAMNKLNRAVNLLRDAATAYLECHTINDDEHMWVVALNTAELVTRNNAFISEKLIMYELG